MSEEKKGEPITVMICGATPAETGPSNDCKHPNTNMGFGLAGGGYGAYEYCEDCGMILHKTQEQL